MSYGWAKDADIDVCPCGCGSVSMPTESVHVTHEMRMAVAREECSTHGHSFDHEVTISCLAPRSVLCHRCGSIWRIHPDDLTENWGHRD